MMYYGVNDSISYIPNNMRFFVAPQNKFHKSKYFRNTFLNKDTKKKHQKLLPLNPNTNPNRAQPGVQ